MLAGISAWVTLRPPQCAVDALLPPEPEPLLFCEVSIKCNLRAPATYRRIMWSEGKSKAGLKTVTVIFDAANAYGTPLRGSARCDLMSALNSFGGSQAKSIEINGELLDAFSLELANMVSCPDQLRQQRTLLELFQQRQP